MTCGIYLIRCKITAIGYVGLSINIERRWAKHIKRFNPDLFTYEILEECAREDLPMREKWHIKNENTLAPFGFNLTTGGQGGVVGRKTSEETKAKIAAKAIGRKVSDETRQKMSESSPRRKPSEDEIQNLVNRCTGVPRSEETKKKLSDFHTGLKHSEETKQKMSEAHKGKKKAQDVISQS